MHDIEVTPDLSELDMQLKLEAKREDIRREIRKELKIKEGAENLRKASKDRKALSHVHGVLKHANSKLEILHEQLQELSAHLLVANNSNVGRFPGILLNLRVTTYRAKILHVFEHSLVKVKTLKLFSV